MQCDTALLEGDVALRREGMARGTEWRETQAVLAHADLTREEARVIARAALEDAADADASGGRGGDGRG